MTEPGAPSDAIPLTPAVGSSPGQRRALALVEVLLCSSVPTQLSIGKLMQIAGWSFEPMPSLAAIALLSVADTVVLVAMMVVLTHAHGESVRVLWLGYRPPWREALLGLSLVPLVFLMVVAMMATLITLLPALHNVATNPIERFATGGPQDAILLGLVAIVAGGVREELQRAFLLRRFERHLGGPAVGVIVLSIAFGLLHSIQGWDATIVTGVLGAFWAIVYLRRRSTIAPMVSHAGFNAFEVLRVAMGAR